jgi:integrase
VKGSLKKRSRDSWTLILDFGRDAGGRRRQKWITVRGNRRDAERELARLLNELNSGAFVEPARLSFRDYAERWLAFMQTRVSPKTFERYQEIMLKHLVPALGDTVLSKLQPLQIQACYAAAQRRDGRGSLAPRTILHHHRVLREALNQAVRWRLLSINPANAVQPPRPPAREIAVPSDADVTALLQAAEGTRLYLPLLAAIGTGLRRGELLALRWSDLDLDSGQLAISQSLEETRAGLSFKTPKIAKGRRTIALPAHLITVLRRHRVDQAKERLAAGPAYQDHGLIFCEPDGQPTRPSTFTLRFVELAKRARADTHLHALRHFHATSMLRLGIHPKVVSERLGHATVGITLDTYSHVIPGLQEQAAKAFDLTLERLASKTAL